MNRLLQWLRARIAPLALAALLVGNMVCATYFWGLVHRVQSLEVDAKSEIQGLRVELDRDARLSEIAIAYTETPEGLRRVPANEGLTREDIAFISRFRGHIVADPVALGSMKRGDLLAKIGTDIRASFAENPANLQLGRTPRAALVSFAVLRTRGSISTYQVRDTVPNNLASLILGYSGNCSDFTLRLMMVLESLGLRASTISVYTPNLMGHVVVDAYDPEEDTAYLLDSTFSVVMTIPQSKNFGFFETVLRMNPAERKNFAESVQLRAFPEYYRFVDPGEQGLKITPLTPQYINQQLSNREPMWRKWLALDTDELANWWKKTPSHAPRTLSEFRRDFVSVIPEEFDRSGDYASRLRAAAIKFLALQPAGVNRS